MTEAAMETPAYSPLTPEQKEFSSLRAELKSKMDFYNQYAQNMPFEVRKGFCFEFIESAIRIYNSMIVLGKDTRRLKLAIITKIIEFYEHYNTEEKEIFLSHLENLGIPRPEYSDEE